MCSTSSGEDLNLSGQNIGNLLDQRRRQLGLVRRRLRPDHHQPERHHRLQSHAHLVRYRRDREGLHPPPLALPVLPVDGQPGSTLVRPSVSTIGQNGDAGNHSYDSHDFFDAINAGNFPAVSFLKAPGYQDAHPGYSDPLDEQTFVVDTINFLMQTTYGRALRS